MQIQALLLLPCALLNDVLPAAGQAAPVQSVDQRVRAKIDNFRGHVTLYAKNLQTGRSYGILPDQPVRTASTIKLAIMVECFSEVADGKLKWTDPIKVVQEEKVSGSGVVQELSDGDELPIRDLMHLMIVVSDNAATNLILNRIGGNAVNETMARLGFQQTRVMRKILGDGANLREHVSGVTDERTKPDSKRWASGGPVRSRWLPFWNGYIGENSLTRPLPKKCLLF